MYFLGAYIGVQVKLFVFDVKIQVLYEQFVAPISFIIHADLDFIGG